MCAIKTCTLIVEDCSNRFAAASKLYSQIFEWLCAVHARTFAGIDLYAGVGLDVTAAGTFSLLTAFDIARALQILNEIVPGNCFPAANLFWRCVNARRTSKDFTFQEVVDARRENDPVIDQKPNRERREYYGGKDNIGLEESPKKAAKERSFRLFVSNHARCVAAAAASNAGNIIIWWTANYHEKPSQAMAQASADRFDAKRWRGRCPI